MTSLSLKQVVEQALAEIGVSPGCAQKPKGKARTTTWIAIESGFGIRHYASGRHVYIVQTRTCRDFVASSKDRDADECHRLSALWSSVAVDGYLVPNPEYCRNIGAFW